MRRFILSLIVSCFLTSAAPAQNWPQFRGPAATGVVEGSVAAVKWDAAKTENTLWKTAIPGLGHSSPVVWGNKVFVSTAVSTAKDETRYGLYGDVAPVKDDPKHTWKLYALDKQTGKILWERVAYEGMPKVKRHPKSTHADSTPVTDGKLFATPMGQGTFEMMALDKISFRPVAFDGLTVVLTVENNSATGFTLKQGTNTTVYKKIEEPKP